MLLANKVLIGEKSVGEKSVDKNIKAVKLPSKPKERRGNNMRRFLSAALIGNVLLLFAGISFAEEKTESAVPIIFEKTENVVIEAGKIRLPQEQVQDEKTGLVVIEAEDAASINYTEKIYQNSADLAGADTEASNGYFISHVQGVKYIFHITKPGKYFIWSRVWQPWEGYWNRTEMMDDDSVSAEANNDARLKADELNKDRNVLASARRNSVTDLNTGEAKVKEWVWIKPRSIATKQPLIYDLSAGKHELKFDFNGGIRLDKIIITDDPSFKPEGKGPAICKGKGADEGLIVTGDITPKTVNKWKSLRGIFSENGGKIGVSYSADRGKTWTEINSDSALDSVPAKGDGSDKMRFRFSVKRSSQNFSPVMSNLELAYLSGNKAGFIQPLSEIPAENMDSTGRFELVPENSLGFVSQNDKSLSLSDQVFYAEKGRPVIFEAEDFVEAKFYPDNSNGVLLEQDASAGKAVYQFPHYRNQLRYDFYLHESAEYSVWFRLRFEQFDGSSFLYASIDEGRQNASGIEMPKGYNPSAGWVFVKGPSFFLGNGVHSFYIRGRLDYVHIDQIAIIRKDKKPEDSGLTGNGPFAVSGVKANGYGEILFSAVSPSSIKNWKKVKTDLKANGGTVTAKVSADNGKTWTDSEKIRTLSVKNDGSDKLIVKLAVQRKNLKNSPELFKTYAEYEPGDRKDIVLKNSLLELFFTPDGALNGLRDVRNDRWILPRGLSQKVFELNIRVKGENNLRLFSPGKGAVLNGREFRKDGKKQSVSFEYAMLDYALRLKFTVALDDSSVSKWNLEITNDSQVEVRDYTFVSFRGFRLGKSGIDDLAAWCTTIGGLYPVPGAAGVNWINQMRYPGDAAMPWTDFSDGQGGVFLCSYDKTLTATDMWCDPGMSLSSWDFGYRKNAYVPPGKKWNTEYEIAVHDKDWHWSADRYHNWFYSWNEKTVYPDWVKNSQGWGGGVLFCCRLYSRFATHWWPRAQWLGLSHFEDWGTTADGESCGLWNHFNPRFGSKEDFAAANKALDKSGAHFGGYINVRGWSDEFVKD
ncbi:MAG: hypothetical protein KKD33_07210, partial [Verrucomicrobia bacterium]|nr:hypothetical protein [Verrucomicrobiota bacterium]